MSLEGISLELIEVFLPEHLNQTLLPSMQHKIKIFGPFLMFHFHQTMLHFLCIFFFFFWLTFLNFGYFIVKKWGDKWKTMIHRAKKEIPKIGHTNFIQQDIFIIKMEK